MGGVQYTRNLLRALALLPEHERPEIILQIGRKNANQGFEEEFSSLPNVVIDRPLHGRYKLAYRALNVLRRLVRRAVRRDISNNVLLSDQCAVAFPAKGPNLPGPASKVYWVPDFQYKHYPEYFSDDERQKRDAMYERMFNEEGILVLSSNAVKADFYRFFPTYAGKDVRVLPFATTLEDSDYAADVPRVCSSYGLPEKFVYLPNQMWQHKGFDTAFQALGILRQQGISIPLVCTGSAGDYRNSAHGQVLKNLLEVNRLTEQVYQLGLLPRHAQIQVFRRAALVLQPSRFEGWSTTVEDARALGKPIILSDIEVHREQSHPQARLFEVGNPQHLADVLADAWTTACAGPDSAAEHAGRLAGNERSLAYARQFLEIMRAAVATRQTADARLF